MIRNLEITGVHMEISADLRKYINKKIGKLDKFFSKHARESARAEVILNESKARDKKSCTCEVILHLPGERLTSKESTVNMFAAVDIVEATLKNQLKKYKELHSNLRIHRRVLARLRRATM